MKIQVEKVKNLIISGELKNALEFLVEETKNTKHEIESSLLLSRINKLEKEKLLNILDTETEQQEFNRITVATMQILTNSIISFFHNDVIYDEVRFFETPMEELVFVNERSYSKSFKKEESRCIGWELSMRSPRTKTAFTYIMNWQITKPNNEKTPKFTTDFKFGKGWANPWIAGSWGNREFGRLEKGVYIIEFEISNKTVKSEKFKIE